jgi:hypothetical protein
MRAIAMSRALLAVATLTLAGACTDSLAPLPNEPSPKVGDFPRDLERDSQPRPSGDKELPKPNIDKGRIR